MVQNDGGIKEPLILTSSSSIDLVYGDEQKLMYNFTEPCEGPRLRVEHWSMSKGYEQNKGT